MFFNRSKGGDARAARERSLPACSNQGLSQEALSLTKLLSGSFGDDMAEFEKRDFTKREIKEINKRLRKLKRAAKREQACAKKGLAQTRKKARGRNRDIQKQLRARAKSQDKLDRAKKDARLKARNVTDAIGYTRMFEDGICEVELGLYSQTIAFDDVSYQSAREERQYDIHRAWCDMLESFDPDSIVQFNVINTPIDAAEIGRREFFEVAAQTGEGAREDAVCFNKILNDKLREGVSNIVRKRYITYTCSAPDPESAVPMLARMRNNVIGALNKIGCKGHVLDGIERLEVLNSQLRPGQKLDFSYDRDISMNSALTTKDAVSPMFFDFSPDGANDHYVEDDTLCQVLVMSSCAGDISDRVIADIVETPVPMNITWFVRPIEKAEAKQSAKLQSAFIDKEIIEAQQKAVSKGYDFNNLPLALTEAKASCEKLNARLVNEQAFMFTCLLSVYAKTEEELIEHVKMIASKANPTGAMFTEYRERQRQGMNSMLPLGNNHCTVSRSMCTSDVAIFTPFAVQELDHKGGNYVGQNKYSNNLVLVDRRQLDSPIGFVCGKTGSGKSFAVKTEIESTVLNNPRDQVIIFDRAGEYNMLVKHLGGTEIRFGVDSETRLNPFDLSTLDDRSLDHQIAFKCDAMLAQAAASAHESGNGLDDADQSIITRAVNEAFRRALERGIDEVPLLEDFYDILREQPEEQAAMIALRYERFVQGSMDFFNRPSNVDWESNVIDINIKDLPNSMLVFALINMCEAVRNQMYKNFAQGRRTWIYIEEIQSLFQYPTVLNYFSRFANESRKFGGFLTGITQSASALLGNKDARDIILNADYLRLLKQSPVDRAAWADLLNLSVDEESCIDESCDAGGGLLIAGAAHVPITGNFPKDNHLYRIFSTDPNEVEQKARAKEFEENRSAKKTGAQGGGHAAHAKEGITIEGSLGTSDPAKEYKVPVLMPSAAQGTEKKVDPRLAWLQEMKRKENQGQ